MVVGKSVVVFTSYFPRDWMGMSVLTMITICANLKAYNSEGNEYIDHGYQLR